MRTRPGSPQALALRRALRRAVRSESERAPLAPPPSGRGKRRWHEISRPEMDDECLRRGRGARRREKQGKAQCGHGGWVRAAQSLRCSMRTHQESVQVCAYRLLITARGCVRACVRAGVCVRVGVWVCGCVGQGQQRGSSDKCLIVISRWSGSPQTTSDSSSCIIL